MTKQKPMVVVDGRDFPDNDSWEAAVWAANGITVSGREYLVPGSSGKSYTVRFAGRGDDHESCLWGCSCPSYQYGNGTCKHIDLVSRINNYIADECGY